jgi:hypothetical protein
MRKVRDGVAKKVSVSRDIRMYCDLAKIVHKRSKAEDLRSHDPVLPNTGRENASSIPNIEVGRLSIYALQKFC